jgi:hypothetical protein
MRYLCLVYNVQEEHSDGMPRPRPHGGDAAAGVRALRRSGHLIAVHAVGPAEPVTVVRVRNGRVASVTSDGTASGGRLYAAAVVEAHDLNEAIRLAVDLAGDAGGRVAIRRLAGPE